MPSHRPARFDHWSTGSKLLVLLSLALFPLGLALAWAARMNLQDADGAIVDASYEDGKAAARAAESLVARNALALRVAANGAIKASPSTACQVAAQSLALTPSVASRFSLRRTDGTMLCNSGDFVATNNDVMVAPGAIALWIAPETGALRYRVGVNDGMATGELTAAELARSVREASPRIDAFALTDGRSTTDIIDAGDGSAPGRISRYKITRGQLTATVRSPIIQSSNGERLAILLPLLMWVVAALLSWFLVRRLLLLPLARLRARGDRLSTRRRHAGDPRESRLGGGNSRARRGVRTGRRPAGKFGAANGRGAAWPAPTGA